MEKIRVGLMNFMRDRYGHDQFNFFVLAISFILILLNLFVRNTVLQIFTDVLLFYAIFRSLSKNIWSRQKENNQYLDYTKGIRSKCNLLAKNIKDKEHHYYLCPNCGQMVRVPKGKGKIEITCPRCHDHFDRKS